MTAMPSLRDPETLHEKLRPVFYRFMRAARAKGLNPILTFGYRSKEAQDRLFQIGRRGVPGEKKITNAKGGQSWHNVERDGRPASLGFDFALLTDDGRAVLSDTDPRWDIAIRVAIAIGLTSGGQWGDDPATERFEGWDKGHCQMDDHGKLTLEQAMSGVDPQEDYV